MTKDGKNPGVPGPVVANVMLALIGLSIFEARLGVAQALKCEILYLYPVSIDKNEGCRQFGVCVRMMFVLIALS